MKGIGLMHRKSNINEVNLQSVFINKKYASVLKHGLKNNVYAEKLILDYSMIDDEKLAPILKGIPNNLLYLDVSQN